MKTVLFLSGLLGTSTLPFPSGSTDGGNTRTAAAVAEKAIATSPSSSGSVQALSLAFSANLNCVFVLDWLYLGSSRNESANSVYLAQRAFVNTVASQLYATPGVIFGADLAPYGDSNAGISDMIIYDSYIRDENSFQRRISPVLPLPQQYPFDVCSAQDGLNPGVSPNLDNIGRDCLVFFSGESGSDFAHCANNVFVDPLDTSLYKFIVGASLNGETGVQSISSTFVPISSEFNQQDVTSLVTTILNLTKATRN